MSLLPLQAMSQRKAWVLPGEEETFRVFSVAGGTTFARDTYLSASRYNGWAVGFENDSWTGKNPDKLFSYLSEGGKGAFAFSVAVTDNAGGDAAEGKNKTQDAKRWGTSCFL